MPLKNIVTGQHVTKEKLERAKELRREMTPAEKILWHELRANKLGVHFRRQQIIQGFIVDFYCHKAGLVIEVDGDIHDLQKEEDERREKVLSEMGLKIVRFRNDEIVRGLSAVVGKIREVIQFVDLFTRSHTQARKAGLTEEEVRFAVKKARKC
jgi:very-short-patch-repair endonuclease